MNKVYRVIWNASLGAWVAVSEITKSKGKKSNKAIKSGVLVSSLVLFAGNAIAASYVGGNATATGAESVAIGDGAKSLGDRSVALGTDSFAQNKYANALGESAKALGDDSAAVGTRAEARANYSTALGNEAIAEKEYDLAVGYQAKASGGQSTAVGFWSKSTGIASNAIGGSSLAAGDYSTAVGQETRAEGKFALAVGYKNKALGEQSTAVGFGSESTGYGSNAIGSSSKAKGLHSTAIGSSSLAEGDYSIALGQEAKTGAGKNFATALGYLSNASGWSSFAQGAYAEASGGGSISIGDSSKATVSDTIAIGTKAKATGSNSISIGKLNIVSGNNSAAIGNPSNISGNNSYSLGNNNTIATDDTFVVGNNVTATKENSVYLGTDAAYTAKGDSTDGDAAVTEPVTVGGTLTYGGFAGKTGGFAGKTPVGVVSVGADSKERRIQNMAAGLISEKSTDAINGSQLYATNEVLGNVANTVVKNFGGNATLDADGNITYTNIGNTGKDNIHDAIAASQEKVVAGTNIASVDKVTDAVKGQSTYTVNAKGTTASAGSSAVTVTAGTPDANNVTDYAVDLSQDTKDSLVKADTALQSIETQIDGVTVKTVNKNDNKVNFVTGDNVELTANADGSITVGTAADVTFNSVTTNNLTATGDTQLGNSFTVNKGGSYYTGPITKGNHITNKTYVDQQTAAAKTEVAAGTNVKDVVKTQGTNGQDIYTVNAKGTTASAGSSAVTVTAGTPDANNVTDYAVDLSQDTKDSLVKADTALQSIETQIDGVTVKTVNKNDNKVNFVTGDNVELTANADGSITVGTAADVTFNSVTTNNLTATGDTQLGNSFTVNKGGSYYTGPITEGNHITNKTYVDQQTAAAKTEVAAGTNVKDVVKTQGTNGQDIYTVNAKGTTASAGSSAVTVTAGTPDANNVTDYAVDLSQDTKDSLVKADTALQSIETQIDGVTVKNVNKNDNKVNFVTGDNVELTANADGSITVGTAADVTFNNVTTNNLTATGDTQLGNSFTVNKGGSYYTGPITEGNHITNKTYVDQQTAAAKTEVAAGTNVKDVVKTQGTNGQDIYTVNAKGTTASAGSSAVTVTAGTPDANNVTDYAVDLSQDTKDSLVKADTALQSIETQIDGVTVKTVNKNDNKVNFVTGDNVELTANADGSITVGTAADVTFNSVTTNNLTATGDTQLGNSFTVNKGGSYYTGPITEGNHITNKTYVDQQTAAAKTEVAAGTNVKDVVKTQGTNGQDIYTVNAKGTTASAGSSAVTVTAGTPDANNVTDYAVDLSQDTKDSLVKADTALQSIETQIDGVTVKNVNKNDNKVNFVTGDNVELTANADGSITVGTAADVTFNNVTTNNLTATGDTQLGNSFTVNKGGSYYTGPITEGNHITNKTYVDQQTAAAKTEVAAGTNVKDVVKTQGTNGQDIYTVNAKGTTASAGSSAVTVTAGTPDANNVTDYAVDLSQDTKDSLVKADTALQSIETQIDGVTVKTVNKNDNKVNFVTGDNVELTANADGSITVGTAADVTFNSVTTNNLTATGDTQLGNSFTVNKGGSYYTGPITEGNHITNKTYVDQQTAAAKTEVAAGTNVKDVVKTQGTNGQDIYTVNAKGTTASAGSSAVTVTAGTPDANNVTDYAVDLSQDTKDSLVKADTALQSIETQIDGVTVKNVNKNDNKVNFVTGDNVELTANADGSITVGTAADVTFNNVTTNNLTATGDTQLGNSFTVNKGGSYYTGPITEGNHITNKTYVDQQTAAAKTEVAAGKNITVTPTTGNDGQTIYNVATADEVDFTKVTVGNTTITTDGLIITGGPSITTAGINAGDKKITNVAAGTATTDGVNVSQLKPVVDALGGGSAINTDGTIKAPTYNITNPANGTVTAANNVGDALKGLNDAVNSPLTFKGDSGEFNRNLGQTTTVKGGITDTAKLSDNNIGVVAKDGTLDIKLAKDIAVDSVKTGDTTVNTYGVSIANADPNKVVSLTASGLNNGNNRITNVAAGQAGTDAVNKDQLDKAQAAATTKVKEADGIKVVPTPNADGSTTYTVSAKTDGTTTKIDGNGNIAAVTTTFTPSTDGKVGAPVGNGDSLVTANTVADAINNSGWKATSGATGSGVVDGTTEELINPSETVTFRAGDNMVLNQAENVFTYSLNKDININSVQFNNGPKITNDGNNIKIGDKDGNATKITNVAAGTGDNDAVNVSQLKAVEATANKGWNLTTNGKPESKSNVKPGDTVDFANEDGNVKIENKGNNVIVNLNKDIDLTKDGSVTIGDTKVNNDGLTIAGGPSVTKSGIDAGDKKITNVAPGKISADSKDAINGSQLYTVQQAAVAAKTEVKAGDNVEVKKESGGNGQDIYTVSAKDTSASVTAGSDAITVTKGATTKVGTTDVTDYKVDLSQATKDNIQKGVDAKGIVDNKGLTFAGDNNSSTEVQKLGSTVNVKGDKNITTQASGNTVKVTLNPNVTVESLTATNSVNVGSGNAQVALTTNVGKDDVRELSVGSANAPTRITNVARGVNDTDAVNLSQLKDLGYNINTKIDKVEKEANAGIASAMAMETAPFIAGKWTYAVGAAYYGGEQAVGATLRKTADNGRWSLTGGVATGTEGDPSVRIGISGVID